ncbi:DNRLRE domain-containing protein [Flavobacterium sp. j3]|uniref:DNRLRE domain-containing protein n=1 Tax=Flavobacterium aureirubrum TaxID=3133147 RepID=A0ABU9N987_9FLAO
MSVKALRKKLMLLRGLFGQPLAIRGLIDFDLSSLPAGVTIQSATLTLYNNPTSQNGNANGQHVNSSGSNESVLQRITAPWTEDVSWSTQPTTTTQNEVTLLQNTSPIQNYVLDVKNLLQDIIANPNSSFGFLLKLKTETPFRMLTFASSDHPNAALHPKLEICYSATLATMNPEPQKNTVALFPNPSSGVVTIALNEANNPNSSTTRFVLYDTTGKKVFEDHHFQSSTLSYDISSLQNGLYYWVVTTDQARSTGKLILNK